jgi:hypothetical protein
MIVRIGDMDFDELLFFTMKRNKTSENEENISLNGERTRLKGLEYLSGLFGELV